MAGCDYAKSKEIQTAQKLDYCGDLNIQLYLIKRENKKKQQQLSVQDRDKWVNVSPEHSITGSSKEHQRTLDQEGGQGGGGNKAPTYRQPPSNPPTLITTSTTSLPLQKQWRNCIFNTARLTCNSPISANAHGGFDICIKKNNIKQPPPPPFPGVCDPSPRSDVMELSPDAKP